jgi:hypothetical protein
MGRAGGGGYGGASTPALGKVSGAEAVTEAKAVQDLKLQSVAQRQNAVQHVNGQAYYQRGEAWVDARYEEEMPTLTVKWGSEAYFQIVRQKPELAKALAQAKKVVVVVSKSQALRVDDTGKETLTAAEQRALGLKPE